MANEMSDEKLVQAILEVEAVVEKGGLAQEFFQQQLDFLRQKFAARQGVPSNSHALVATSSHSHSHTLVLNSSDAARLATRVAELEEKNAELEDRLRHAEADELHTLHIREPDAGVPLQYALFKPGDQITTYTGEVITVTDSMRGLLGTADNRLAKLPQALIEFARDFLAILVTMNNTVIDHEVRCGVKMFSSAVHALPGEYSTEFSPSVLMQFMSDRHDSCRIMPEQCVKSYETAQLCLYSRLVLGCVPIVSVRNCGGRIVAAGSMKDSLNGVLMLRASEKGLLPSTNDIVRKLLAMPKHRHILRHELDRFFFVEAEEVLAGKEKLREDVISVMLQNEAAGKKLPRLQQVLVNGVGLIETDGQQRSRIFHLHDEGDLLLSANGKPHVFVQKSQGEDEMPPMYSMFITATAAEVMVAQREVTPYLYSKLPYNYHGFHNNCIEFRVIERGMEPDDEFEDEVRFPKLGLELLKEIKGEKAITNGQFRRLKHTLRHMVNHPHYVLPGWRHAAVFIRVAKLQNMLAQYIASLLHNDAPLNFITMEWHSPYVKNIVLRDPLHPERKAQPPVRIFMNRKLFDDVVKLIWSTDYGGGHFSPAIWQQSTEADTRDFSLQYITPDDLAQAGLIQRETIARHCEIACISLTPDATMRKAVTMVEKVWRCCGGMSPEYGETHPYDQLVRVVCFSGEINGRQQPNKSERHTTVLTDFVHDSTAAQHAQAQDFSAFTKAMSVPTFSQTVSRICGVTLFLLANRPILWADRNAEECLRQYRGQMRELISMRSDASGESLANIFRGGIIDRRRHPYLADLKNALEAIAENTSHRRKPQSGQVTAMNTPGSRKSAGVNIVYHTTEVAGAAGTMAASDARTPLRLLGPQFTEDQKTLAPPRDPNAAARMREEDAKAREGLVLSNLKSTARLSLFGKGNDYADFASWRELVRWYKQHAELDAHGLPDWATPIPQSVVDSMHNSVRYAHLFQPKNKWSTHMQLGHERFFDHNAEQGNYVMATFLQDAMNSLRDTVRGAQGDSYDVYDLWLGIKPGKYRQCLRDVLRLVLNRAPDGVLPSYDLGVFSHTEQLLSVDEVKEILNDRGHSRLESFHMDSYARGSGHQAWAYPPLEKATLHGHEYFYLSKKMVLAINEHNLSAPASRRLSIDNLHLDPRSGGDSGKEQSFNNGDVVVKLRNEDIATAATEAVVNAANIHSFTPKDLGVSGALRLACGGLSACDRPKKLLLEGGAWSVDVTIVPEGHTGVEPVDPTSNLGGQGVKYMLHTVGPQWPDSPTEEESKDKVKGIREAVSHALCVAETLKCRSVTLPPISGGFFSQKNERSEQAARSALISEVKLWANRRPLVSSLKEVIIVDKSIGGFKQLLSAWEREMPGVQAGEDPYAVATAIAGPSRGPAPARNGKAPARGKRPRETVDLIDGSDWDDNSDSVEMQQAILETAQAARTRNPRAPRQSTAKRSINYCSDPLREAGIDELSD